MGLMDKIVRALALRWARGKIGHLRSDQRETTMGKVLKFVDGWKLVIAVLAIAGASAWDMAHNGHAGDVAGIVLALLGYTPGAEWSVLARDLATHGLAIVALVHKVIKAQQQVRAGSSVSGSLSAEGYVSKAVADAFASEAKSGVLDAITEKATTVAQEQEGKIGQ